MEPDRWLVVDHDPQQGEPVGAVLIPINGCPQCGTRLSYLTRSRGSMPVESMMLECGSCERHWQIQARLSQAPRSPGSAAAELHQDIKRAGLGRAPSR